MRPYIYPNPENATLEELEQAIKASADRFMTRRLDNIRLLLKGNPYQLAVDYSLKSERTVRRWVAKWNESGIDGLASKPGRGRKPKINAAQGKIIGAVLEHPEDFGEIHWTLQGVTRRALAMEFGYSTFTRWVRRLGYRRLVPRPTAPDRDPTARQAFAQELSKIYQQDPESVWFMDEAGFLADPRPKRMFARKGTKPVSPATGLHIRESVIGGVQPESGKFPG